MGAASSEAASIAIFGRISTEAQAQGGLLRWHTISRRSSGELYRPSWQAGRRKSQIPRRLRCRAGQGRSMPKAAEYRTRCRLPTASHMPSRCRRRAREKSRAISTSSPPLEGFWWQDRTDGEIDYARKDDFIFISHPSARFRHSRGLRLGSFEAAAAKLDFSAVELLRSTRAFAFSACIPGPYDDEPATIDAMRTFAAERGATPLTLRSPSASRRHLSTAQVRAGSPRRDPSSPKVDLAKRVTPIGFGFWARSPWHGRQRDAPCDRWRRPRRGSARSFAPPRTASTPRSWR